MMSKANQFRTYVAAGIGCLALLAAACSTDEDGGTALPDGKYPMTFTTQVEGLTATRAATANGQWTVTDRIALQIGSEVKQYTPTSGGSVSATLGGVDADNTFYWQKSDETKNVSAWYCGDGSTASGQTNANAVPASWAVQSDQSGDGYQQSDFLYAPATDITFASRSTQPLKFHHQTAKVIINIKNEEAATDAGNIQSVVIGHENNLALKGTYTAPTSGSTAGTWTPATDNMGTITTKQLTTPNQINGVNALASYAALVIPQQMKDKKFIAVTLSDGHGGSDTYCYTPTAEDDAKLQSGKQYTYDITVKYGSLEVTVRDDTMWSGDSADVNGNAQTVTPGTDGNGSSWIPDGTDASVAGMEKIIIN